MNISLCLSELCFLQEQSLTLMEKLSRQILLLQTFREMSENLLSDSAVSQRLELHQDESVASYVMPGFPSFTDLPVDVAFSEFPQIACLPSSPENKEWSSSTSKQTSECEGYKEWLVSNQMFIKYEESDQKKPKLCSTTDLDKLGAECISVKIKNHKKSKKGEESKHYCTYPGCNKGYIAKFSLKRHEKKHRGEKPFVCTQFCQGKFCGKAFSERWELKRHQRRLDWSV